MRYADRVRLDTIDHLMTRGAATTHYNLGVSPLFAAVTLDFLDAQPS